MKIKHESNRLPDYVVARQKAYLPLEEQFDLLYHDPEAWRAHVSKVKADHPKPSHS